MNEEQGFLWAGDEESFWNYVRVSSLPMEARSSTTDPFRLPPLMEAQDGVGMIRVSGALIPGTAGWMRMYGIMGYDDILEGLQMAVDDRSVKSVMIHYATTGGAVEGVDETSEQITMVSKLKPVISYAGGNMLSAGYWLGSAGRKRFASRTSMVGSIGVIVTHFDRSEQLKQMGIKATTFRSGKWKGLGGPNEPLTEQAKETIQKTVDDMNKIFEGRVAANLKITSKEVHDRLGQGRQFLGADAFEIGLVDGISTLQQAFAVAQSFARG